MLCPKCGQTNGETAPYCIYCGQMLRVVDISTPPAMSSPGTGGSRSAIPVNPPRVAPPRPQPGVPSLPTGAPLPPEYVSPPGYLPQCRVCGTRITPKLYQCPRCGTPVGSIANPYDATSATYLPTGVPYMPVGGVAPIISNTSG